MEIAIIVSACNRPASLRRALTALASEGVLDLVTIVVDGGDQKVCQVAKGFGASVLTQPHQGVSVARNTGADATSGDWLVFLDDDVVVQSGWYERLENALRDAQAELLSGTVLYEHAQAAFPHRIVENQEGRWPLGAHLIVSRKLWDRTEGFIAASARLHNEDLEFVLQALEEGATWGRLPDVVVHHEALWWPSPVSVIDAAERIQEVPRLIKNYPQASRKLPFEHIGPVYFYRELLLLLFLPLTLPLLLLRFLWKNRRDLPAALPYFFAKWPCAVFLRRYYLWKSAWKNRVYIV